MIVMEKQSALPAILAQGAVHSVYQPIVSLIQQRIVGYEGLCRGIDPETGGTVAPLVMFEEASRLGMPVLRTGTAHPMRVGTQGDEMPHGYARYETGCPSGALDRLCRERCLAGFVPLLELDPA